MKKINLITVLILLVLIGGIGIASAETVSGTLGQAGSLYNETTLIGDDALPVPGTYLESVIGWLETNALSLLILGAMGGLLLKRF